MKIKTFTLTRKQTNWEIKEVFVTINLEIRVTILGIQVGTTLEIASMIGQQTEIKEIGKIGIGTGMIAVVCKYPHVA